MITNALRLFATRRAATTSTPPPPRPPAAVTSRTQSLAEETFELIAGERYKLGGDRVALRNAARILRERGHPTKADDVEKVVSELDHMAVNLQIEERIAASNRYKTGT